MVPVSGFSRKIAWSLVLTHLYVNIASASGLEICRQVVSDRFVRNIHESLRCCRTHRSNGAVQNSSLRDLHYYNQPGVS
jgi:hypothetical protein